MEGLPTLEQVITRLKWNPAIRRLRVMPFMVVAGDHAKNDMAGDEEDSWKSRLEKAGYQVSCIMKGLGEFPMIQDLFADRALAAADKF